MTTSNYRFFVGRLYHSFRRPRQHEHSGEPTKSTNQKTTMKNSAVQLEAGDLLSKDQHVQGRPVRVQRTFRHLFKPALFALGFSGVNYVVACISNHEQARQFKEYLLDSKNWGYEPDPKRKISIKEAITNGWTNNNITHKVLWVITEINLISFIFYVCWRVAPTQKFMIRNFVCDFFSEKLHLSSMLLSPFSHTNFASYFVNMTLVTLFGIQVALHLGPEQFDGFYYSSVVFSSLAGLTLSAITRRSLYGHPFGAAGPLFAIIIYLFARHKNARVKLNFLPQFSIPTSQVIFTILFLQVLFVILSTRYAHPFFLLTGSHLGGSLFGLWYCWYGEKLLWKQYRPVIVQKYVDMTGRK